MDVDQSDSQKAQTLQSLTSGSLGSSLSKLAGSSQGIPAGKDFHFYYNFDEFKIPIRSIDRQSQSMLETIGSSAEVWGKEMAFPEDNDDAYDWLVNVNDDILERFDVSLDEFQRIRKEEEESGRAVAFTADADDGFQLVCGKKKKSPSHGDEVHDSFESSVKVATKDRRTLGVKPKVPFHIPTIRRPQDEFNILVNNANQPFEHVWLQRSEDGTRFVHPLEKLSVLDFVDKINEDFQPVYPPSLDCTPFKFIEEVNDLKELAAKLRRENEFAVDLEHNQYRSFQGLTCLMQISTRTEDFVVDTLKLRIHVGPYLREVFKDPSKRKVLHGADRDVVWLQRDFGIYICNLFDTGQASRVLKLERNSLEYLLHHFCGVAANKEYQNADWRLRPLPEEMLRYAREDTHYLLYIYDLMRKKLSSMPRESEESDLPLVEVYKRSYDVCLHLYEKELLTESSYFYVYGLQGSGFNAQQLAVAASLFEWRDIVARAEDESTGYILPNKTLLEIAKQMPVTINKLRRLLKSKHSFIERNLASIVTIIRHSMLNSSAFEEAAERLKEVRTEAASEENTSANEHQETNMPDTSNLRYAIPIVKDSAVDNTANDQICSSSSQSKVAPLEHGYRPFVPGKCVMVDHSMHPVLNGMGPTTSELGEHSNGDKYPVAQVTGVNITLQKKTNRGGLGSLLGNSAPKRKLDTDIKDKEENKLDKIRSSVTLPFHSFLGTSEPLKSVVEPTTMTALKAQNSEAPAAESTKSSNIELPAMPVSKPCPTDEIIMLEDDSDDDDEDEDEELHPVAEAATDEPKLKGFSASSPLEIDDDDDNNDEPISLSELSSSFQKCLNSNEQAMNLQETDDSGKQSGFLQIQPFDYKAARKQIEFGEDLEEDSKLEDNKDPKASKNAGAKSDLDLNRVHKNSETVELPQGKRRHAFPATGNRSATFR
ncbi:protein RRP6-like 2 [Cucurbita pepo subsp. pepo]|uniref:protein RRP6-like 2 n=1 Tax=Cucurbita pepo subsp. pepo TaxID=3664 RepID=UPI000C9D331C|nr:protein RRP6-like 2 [Cucurbita pepo subsp. pepo]